jgi:small GTP-binding protein
MVKVTDDKKTYYKIVIWGPASSGKTTIIDTLYMICSNTTKDIVPIGDITKISMESGATLVFDRGVFQSRVQTDKYFHIYTVAGQVRFSPLRKKVFIGADAVIFVADANKQRLDDNIQSLKELIGIVREVKLNPIPIIFMLNKWDLEETITLEGWAEAVYETGLSFEPTSPIKLLDPLGYATVAIFENKQNIYRSFIQMINHFLLSEETIKV